MLRIDNSGQKSIIFAFKTLKIDNKTLTNTPARIQLLQRRYAAPEPREVYVQMSFFSILFLFNIINKYT